MISLVDESILDPGAHLPVLSGVQSYWNLAGTDIEIIWDISNDEKVTSYSVYYSLEPFSDTRNSSLLADNITSNTISFNLFNGIEIQQSETYWIAVVASDGESQRLGVNPLEVKPWTDYTPGGGGLLDDGSGISWMEQLLDGNMNFIIILISSILIFIGAVLIIKPRDKVAPEPWEMGTDEVNLEDELTQNDEDLEDIIITPKETIVSKDDIEQTQQFDDYSIADINPNTNMISSDVENELLDSKKAFADSMEDLDKMADLMDSEDLDKMADSLSKEGIDTSFLDDMLEDQ